jgi:importin-5
MPGVKEILLQATTKDLLVLRGKAMECAGLIGEAVGVQKFAHDAIQIMQIFMHILQMDIDRDITFEYLLPACARIAKALGSDFVPHLPPIFQVILSGANQDLQFNAEEVGEDEASGDVVVDEDAGTESKVVDFGAGIKIKMSMNTHAAQQKKQAAHVLYEFAESIGAHLGNLIFPSLETSLKLLQERFLLPTVKVTAAKAVAKLFEALLEATATQKITFNAGVTLDQIFVACVQAVASVLKHEVDPETRGAKAECLRDLLQAIFEKGVVEIDGSRKQGFPLLLSEEMTMIIVSCVLEQSAEAILRRNQAIELLQGKAEVLDEEDYGDSKETIEQEEDVLGVFIDIVGHLVKLKGEAFMNIFDSIIAPAFATYLSPQQPPALQAIACCLIDDALEYGGDSAWKYIPNVVPLLLLCSQSDDKILIQCSLYGLAVACKKAPPAMMISFVPPLLSCFVSTLIKPLSSEEAEEYAGILENAVFGLSSLLTNLEYRSTLHQQSSTFPIPEMMKLWMKRMPLKLDGMEVQTTLVQITDIVERWDEDLIGKDGNLFLNDILRIFGEVIRATNRLNGGSDSTSVHTSPASVAKLHESDEIPVYGYAHDITLHRIKEQILKLQRVPNGSAISMNVQKAYGSLSNQLQNALSCIR